jgi:hypothetical protein
MKFNTIPTTCTTDPSTYIYLMDIYTEAPNYVSIYLSNVQTTATGNTVDVNMQVGQNVFTAQALPTTNLMKTSLITFAVDFNGATEAVDAVVGPPAVAAQRAIVRGAVTMTYNYGADGTNGTSVVLKPPKSPVALGKIKLGSSPIQINSAGNMNAQLYAFILYQGILSSSSTQNDINALATFFTKSQSGYTNAMAQLQQAAADLAQAQGVATSVQTQLQDAQLSYS